MKHLFLMSLIGISTFCGFAQYIPKIIVHTDKPAIKSSSMLQGIFIEDWSHQIEGGIYGEMIRNRSFDDTNSAKEVSLVGFAMNMPGKENMTDGKKLEITGWKKIEAKSNTLQWSYNQSNPLNVNNVRSLKLEVSQNAGKTGIYNLGHCSNVEGIAVTKAKEYLFSCFLRSETNNASLTVNIEAQNGKILSTKIITGLTNDWKKFEFALTPSESLTGARLFILPTVAGTYYLDMISLFPKETWKNRPNGLRKDIMELVAAMKPAFVRFPGGCFVEGLGIVNSWQWKKTLGPVEQREGHWNIWGWRSTDGLGYHEYLQLCEDLNAEPIHVVNDGISHDINDPYNGKYEYVPMDKMPELVQDALDAIEYANGDVTTKWGAKRAEAGHPKPFNLKYIEVGNENFGAEYAERYPLFQDAIKAKYPEITVIMDTYGADNYPRNIVPDMRDIHRFASPYLFAINYHQFDNYDRKDPKVYFGEWCVNLEEPNKESLFTGLHEGIFLTGLEKNSDHVLMQSYAPFMKNMGWKDGKPNMINFDLDRVYGAPIYWIQKMYAENPVDSLLKFDAVSPIIQQEKTGTAGFGVQDTKAEFKDIQIQSGREVLEVGVNLTKNDLKFNGIDSKVCLNNENGFAFEEVGNQSVAIKNVLGANYSISFKARKLSGKNGFRLFFHGNNFCEFGGNGNKMLTFGGEYFWKGGGLTPEYKTPNLTIENNRWYEVKLVAKGYDLSFYLDGVLVNSLSLAPVNSLYVSAGKSVSKNDIILKVINVSSTNQRTKLQLPTLNFEPTAEVTLLTSKNKYDENSLQNPTKVVPQKFIVKGVSSDFEYVFPANSATILKLKRK